MSVKITVTFDRAQLARLQSKLDPKVYRELIRDALIDAAHIAEGEIKDRTPVVSGNLRRSFQPDYRAAGRFPNAEARIESRAVYAGWVETGEDSRGRKMRTRPGGYRMVQEGALATADKLGEVLDSAARKIEERWAA